MMKMIEPSHIHKWRPESVGHDDDFDYSPFGGMRCSCGKQLTLNALEDLVNDPRCAGFMDEFTIGESYNG